MPIPKSWPRVLRWAAIPLTAAVIAFTAAAASPAGTFSPAGSLPQISGSGSSYAAVAIDDWISTLAPSGIAVNYNPDGSLTGQEEFINDQDDFTASDIPFPNGEDQLSGLPKAVVPWSFSYLPAVPDTVAFPYRLSVHGHLIRNLRLSGETLMEIFTGQITNWDSPQITRDYGHRLPSLRIIPVIHADYAGTTYYFTRWMAHVFPSQWNKFCERVHPGVKLPCGQTVLYPPFGDAKALNGSANVVSYLATPAANGAIGYDEYPYVTTAREPAVALRNPAGDYVLPTPVNVTTALTRAVIDEDPHSPNYLQENLDRVYTFGDPKSYPLSAYSYFIVPRAPKPPAIFGSPPGKGRTLSALLDFALCQGQRQLAVLGYAPLPANLVAGGLLEVKQIPGHGKVPTLAQCQATRDR
jgi:ABC-type phosphate transport system substrate-binding protein